MQNNLAPSVLVSIAILSQRAHARGTEQRSVGACVYQRAEQGKDKKGRIVQRLKMELLGNDKICQFELFHTHLSSDPEVKVLPIATSLLPLHRCACACARVDLLGTVEPPLPLQSV